ncbi:MAG: efflux RND transporter permease subunit, partial [Pseudomonadota bacterium]
DTFGHIFSLTGEGFSPKELRDTARDIRDVLLDEGDIARVTLHGDIEEVIYIDYNNTRLTELGISPTQLSNQLGALNILSSGGDLTVGIERIVLEPTGNFDTLQDIENAIIEIPGSRALVQLGDLAEVYRDYEDPPSEKVRNTGLSGISIAISLRDGGNILELGERLEALMPQISADLPLGLEITPLYLQSKLTSNSVDSFVSNLVQAVSIVMIVMIVSLGFRTGIVVASLIPVVMISTFVVMQQFAIGIDQISLAALIIALGLLVDNAIVVVEATTVRRQAGEDAISAAVAAASEMKGPLLISSLTTAAAFTPIALAESAVGEFTLSIFQVVTIALLLSWLISMTFVPMLTPFIKVASSSAEEESEKFNSKFYQTYRGILLACLRNRAIFAVLVVGIFSASIYGMSYVPQVFIEPSEDPVITAKLELPTGTDIAATEQAVVRFENFLEEELSALEGDTEIGVDSWTAYIGAGGPRFVLGFDPPNPSDALASMIINVRNSESIDPIKTAIDDYFFENEPDMLVQVKRLANGPPVSYPIEIKLIGEEFDALFDIMAQVKEHLWTIDEVTAVQDAWGPQSKKLLVDVDQSRSFRSQVTSQDIATSLNTGLKGMDMTQFREGDDVIPVKLRTLGSNRDDLGKLENLTVFSQSNGAVVPLNQVADIKTVWEPARIKRLDRKRMINVQVQLAQGVTAAEIMNRLRPWLDEKKQDWPLGYDYIEGGETEESEEAAASIVAALPFACVAILMLLVLQFNSFRKTMIVVTTIPLGLIGIVIGMLVTGSSFGFFTFLGLISLAGIIINNAIVLLDRIKLEIDENGLAPSDAVVQAAQQRTRPILLTTATTVGGMIPLWISGGPMFESMAVAILFGLLFATLITLILVPVMYSAFFRIDYA